MGFLSALGIKGFLTLLAQLAPLIQMGIHIAEKANPNSGEGAKKFTQVLDSAMTVAGALPQVVEAVQATGKSIGDAAHAGDVQALSGAVGQMINIAVATANAAGAFQKSGFVQAVTAAQQGKASDTFVGGA